MSGRRSTGASISPLVIGECLQGAPGWGLYGELTGTQSRLRGDSTRAAADRCAAMAIRISDRAMPMTIRSEGAAWLNCRWKRARSEEHTSELQSLMRSSYAVFCLKKKTNTKNTSTPTHCVKSH